MESGREVSASPWYLSNVDQVPDLHVTRGGPVVRLSLHYVSAPRIIAKPRDKFPVAACRRRGRASAGVAPSAYSEMPSTTQHRFVLEFGMYLLFPQQPGWILLCLVFRPNSQKQKETP